MEINENEIEKLKKIQYDGFLEKCINKNYLDIISNPTGFVRGIPKQLSDDISLIKKGGFPEKMDKETLLRIKYICEFSIPKSLKKRNKMISTQYQDALKWAESLLKGF